MSNPLLAIGRSLIAASIVAAVALTLLPWVDGFRAWFGDPDFPVFSTLQWLAALYLSLLITLSSAQLAVHHLGREAPADRGMAFGLGAVSLICGLLHIRIYWEDSRDASAIALSCCLVMFIFPAALQAIRSLLSKVAGF
jgi:hypothetical protein